jgi:hypothetical protein
MHSLRVWGLSAALAAAGGAAAVAAPPGGQTTLINKLFGPKPPKPVGPTAAPQRPLTITTPLSQDVLADALRAEQDAYLRRVTVCTELRRVAAENGDKALERQADELERQATALYNARVAGLGVSRVKAPLPGTADATTASARTAADRLAPPTAPVPGTTTAQVREVTP